jgi:hypothetical protein
MVAVLGAHAGAVVDTGRPGGQSLAQLAAGDPVTRLQATGAASQRVVLSWLNPAGVEEIIVRYSTAAAPDTPAQGTGWPVTGTPERVTVQGLTNHTRYHFSVFAVSGGVTSPPTSIAFAPYVCPKVTSAMDLGVLQVEKIWLACSAPWAHDSHNTLDTVLTRNGPEQALMTTGDREISLPPSDGDAEGRDNNAGARGALDVSTVRIRIDVPAGDDCVRFDYVFASEGYPEVVGDADRDGFLAQLDGDTWRVAANGTLQIGAAGNFAELPDGTYVGPGSSLLFGNPARVVPAGVNGTGYDGMTRALNASAPVTPGMHELFLSIFDMGTPGTDSAVFVDRLRTAADDDCTAGTNRWPTAVNDTASSESGDPSAPIDLLDNDTDLDGDTLNFVIASGPAHGSLDCTATCEYTSDPGFIGTDTFTYRVADGNGGTDSATASVQVTAPSSEATLAVSRGVLKWPAQVNVSGELRVGGAPAAAGVEVHLMAGPNLANLRSVGTTQTDADGTMSLLHRPGRETVYQWRVGGNDVVSGTRTVRVAPALTVGVTKPALGVGDTTQIKGKTSPSRKGTPVLLQRWNGASWVTVQQTTVNRLTRTLKPSGPFAFSVKARASGVGKFRVVVQADAGRLQAVSPARQVTVYDAQITRVSKTADEFVVVKNTGKVRVNLKGWKLVNKKGTSVTLPKRFIAAGKVLKIHTGSGNSNLKNLYLGRGAMFANTHDRVSLVDRNKFLVSRFTY